MSLPPGYVLPPVEHVAVPHTGVAQITWHDTAFSRGRIIVRLLAPPWHQTGVQPFGDDWVQPIGNQRTPLLRIVVAREVRVTQAMAGPDGVERRMKPGESHPGAGLVPYLPSSCFTARRTTGLHLTPGARTIDT
jgi:hypothetical protein